MAESNQRRGAPPSRATRVSPRRDPGKQKRALSMPRAPGRIERDGVPASAEILEKALRAAHIDDVTADSLTHPLHSYPARMHAATANVLVEALARSAPENAVLFDPFCGSGTTLVEARAAGLTAIGGDLNPLAVRIARAKTWTMPQGRRNQLRDIGRDIVNASLAAAKAARSAAYEPAKPRGPRGFDPNARNRRLASWFAPHVRRELEFLAAQIDEVAEVDEELADILMVPLSAILYKVSSRTSDTDPTWVARNIGRGNPTRLFAQRVELLVAGLDDLCRARGALPQVHEIDARQFSKVMTPGSAWACVTSPPYVGTYDYAEHQRLRFDFFGLRRKAFDEGELGSRRSYDGNADYIAKADASWRDGLGLAIDVISNALAPGRLAVIVIGDSIAQKKAYYALDEVRSVLRDEFVVEAWAAQERPMLGEGERRAFGERVKAEYLIALRKRA